MIGIGGSLEYIYFNIYSIICIYKYIYMCVCLWENLYLEHQKIMRGSLNTWSYLNKNAFVQPKHMNVIYLDIYFYAFICVYVYIYIKDYIGVYTYTGSYGKTST